MTLTIELTPGEQERVTVAARQEGLEPAEFIRKLVAERLPEDNRREQENGSVAAQTGVDKDHFYFTASREEFNAALDNIAEMNINLPVLTESAFDRENLHENKFCEYEPV